MKLKLFNGRGHGKFDRHYMYVAATSQAQCARLLSQACETHVSVSEISVYYNHGSWGNSMDGIIPTEPCVYAQLRSSGNPPTRIL